jgi:regulatory protein
VAKITALRSGKGRSKKANISLDGKYAFSLEAEVALKEGLKVGQELSAGQIEALKKVNNYQRCYDAAARYLSYRPRSEYEMRRQLTKHHFDDDSIEAVLSKLKEQGLVDDSAFAKFWKENRQSFSPRSQWLTRLELKQKGVPDDVIDQVVNTIDDDDNAYRAATSRVRSLKMSDYHSFRHRLGEYLRRRGFDYGVINRTIERLWQEREAL